MALAADVVAGPPAVVVAADLDADLDAGVVDGPHPLQERRRGVRGQQRRRPSCRRCRRRHP